MQKKHVPVRMCTACRQRRPKTDLLRIARLNMNQGVSSGFSKLRLFIDNTQKSQGRGTYMCKDLNCLKKAKKMKKLEKLFTLKAADDLYLQLEKMLSS